MPDTCASVDGVRRQIKARAWRRVGIDGVTGAGKSSLADDLGEALGIPVLDVDDYVHKRQGGYVDFIDYPALSGAIRSMPNLILNGVCLRQVLSNLGTDLDGHIYVMRMRDGLWLDEDECVFPDGVDAAIEALADQTAMISRYLDDPGEQVMLERDDDSLRLTYEVMRYHSEYVPHENADIIYERSDEAG